MFYYISGTHSLPYIKDNLDFYFYFNSQIKCYTHGALFDVYNLAIGNI